MFQKAVCLLVVLVLSNVSFCVAADVNDAMKDELQKLEGTWVTVAMEDNGQKHLIKDMAPLRENPPTFVWKDGKGTYNIITPKSDPKNSKGMPIVIDPTKTPKTLDVLMDMPGKNGPTKVAVIVAIYQLTGDTLEICYSPGMPRPKEIKSEAKTFIMTLERQKK